MAAYGDCGRIDLSDLLVCRTGTCGSISTTCGRRRRKRWHRDRVFGRKFVERFRAAPSGRQHRRALRAHRRRRQAAAGGSVDRPDRAPPGACAPEHPAPVFHGGRGAQRGVEPQADATPLDRRPDVPPSPGDAGTALGAAAWVAMELGDPVKPLPDAYLGPDYDGDSIARELEGLHIPYERLADPASTGASLLAAGEVVAWFQGRMEWGPRALGNRSTSGHPGVPGTADDINARIKYRGLASLLPVGAGRVRGGLPRLEAPVAIHDALLRPAPGVARAHSRDHARGRDPCGPRSYPARPTLAFTG